MPANCGRAVSCPPIGPAPQTPGLWNSALAMRGSRADDCGHMKPGLPSLQTAAVVGDGDLLELLSEFVDAHADTVQLILSEQPTELAWLAHCDYLRALQRLGNETLAHHDQRRPAPFAPTVVSGLNTALSRGWRSALVVLRAPGRAARWRPAPIAQR